MPPGGILGDESGLLVLDLSRRELRASGVSVPIGGRAFEILAILVQSAEELVDVLDLLAPVYSKFTERFGTSDLRAARAILESTG